MSCRGVHFAIDAVQAERLLAAEDDEALVEIVQEEIEEAWELAFETDKAWDALHRCLSDGTLTSGAGEPPLNRVFFGGRVLNESAEYFVVLVTPSEVEEIAAALAKVTEAWLKARYFETPFPAYQGEKSAEDWEYTIGNFEGLPEFFARAASEGRYVIFTVDQ
ncbi:MAG: YfbM family protein [Deltaproteobacteria bacterium]|nr:YfbM family protein [Deltaproteobacteria bacterium]